MGIYDELQTISTQSPTPKVTPKPKERKPVEQKKETENKQSTTRRINQPIGQSTNPLIDVDELGPAVKKPKGSYITQKVNQKQSSSRLSTDKKNDNVSNNAGSHANVHASTLACIQDDIVETIRKTVKQVGKEALFVRLTTGEKHQVTSVVYAYNEMYRGESHKTTENEIGRIGVNFILEDYKANGKDSILGKVLAALNA